MRTFYLLVWLVAATACSDTPAAEFPGGPLSVALAVDAESQRPIVRVTGWSSAELEALRSAGLSRQTWEQTIQLRVASSADIIVAGHHRVTNDAVELVPQFALDRGRGYLVHVNTARLPTPRSGPPIDARVSLPAIARTATTQVTSIDPTSQVWPENILRFYLHFSAPMSGASAVDHVRLVDDQGREIPDALLEVDVDLWNDTYTRRTVFFDPGRVKRGILPNRELGRALVEGRTYAIVVATSWKDGNGQPLASEFRHTFTAGPPIERPLDPSAWTMAVPEKGSRSPLVIRFPWPLDAALLTRAVGVTTSDGQPLDGHTTLGPDQRSWMFTPAQAWPDAALSVAVLTLLEDPSGNKVGQAFEFDGNGQTAGANPERVTLPFRPR